MFLIILPAGAIADIFDPRRLIVAVSGAVMVLMAIFAAIVSFNLATPALLLVTTFLLSAAWALNSPAWLSILPILVPKRALPGAIAAQGVAYNVSRTVGPTLGGLIIMKFGMSAPLWALRRGQSRGSWRRWLGCSLSEEEKGAPARRAPEQRRSYRAEARRRKPALSARRWRGRLRSIPSPPPTGASCP